MPQRTTNSIISPIGTTYGRVRKLGDEHVLNMLDDAIDLLPRSKL